MDTLETLYFPDTVMTDDSPSLFLFFNNVHILQPVEDDETAPRATGTPDTFMDEQFCQVHTPAPLGPDRDRFLRLVKDIKERKDDYAAQLSSLTIASLSASNKNDEESRHSIITSLFGTPTENQKGEKQELAKKAELWQARLVLAIAEVLDREDEEVADALKALGESQTDLFDRLLGKDEEFEADNPFVNISRTQNVALPRPGLNRNRMKAWLSLYKTAKLPDLWLWTTDRQEVADIVFEMYEKKSDKAVDKILHLELPRETGIEPRESFTQIKAFRKEAEPLLVEITNGLTALACSETASKAALSSKREDWEKRWATLLEAHFPAQQFGRNSFCLYLLTGQSLSRLAGAEPQGDKSNGGTRHAILAIVA